MPKTKSGGFAANPQIARARDRAFDAQAAKSKAKPAPAADATQDVDANAAASPAVKVETHHPDSPDNPSPGTYTSVVTHADGTTDPAQAFQSLDEAQQNETEAFGEDQGGAEANEGEGNEEAAAQPGGDALTQSMGGGQ